MRINSLDCFILAIQPFKIESIVLIRTIRASRNGRDCRILKYICIVIINMVFGSIEESIIFRESSESRLFASIIAIINKLVLQNLVVLFIGNIVEDKHISISTHRL